MENEIEHEHTDEIVCPYCGYKFSDSYEWEAHEHERTIECHSCEKKFNATATISVSYSTHKDCELNGEQHDFEPFGEPWASHYQEGMWLARRCCKNCKASKSLSARSLGSLEELIKASK